VNRKRKPRGSAAGTLRVPVPGTSDVIEIPPTLPLLPLRDLVIFPHSTLPLFVGRRGSVAALEEAGDVPKVVLAVTQKRPETAAPRRDDLYDVGTVVRILQLFRLPDGSLRILAEGLARGRLVNYVAGECAARAGLELLDEAPHEDATDLGRMLAAVKRGFARYVERNRRIAPEVALAVRTSRDASELSFRAAAHLQVSIAIKQRLLECGGPSTRLRELRRLIDAELRRLTERQERDRCTPRHGETPPDVLMGGGEAARGAGHAPRGEFADELEEIAHAIEDARMPEGVEEKAFRELDRLGKMSLISPEATVSRSYLDWLVSIPWQERTRDRTALDRVLRILDEDHFGLRKVKERILEQISVIKLSREVRGPILCFCGPPGVGKTSLGRSIARALGRRFVRMSLGGIRDEAEIRGHRRTYIGSLPGRIIQAMRRAGSINPVILLDEVDKLGADHRGDPAAGLLEVLDPEQNSAFNDHYLEVDYDLSKVLFITTANLLHAIPEPLRDRMELIRLPGYLETEKVQIARKFLLPRQRKANGLVAGDLDLPTETFVGLIRGYTREAGVRNLEREIARICRRVAKVKAGGEDRVLGRVPARAARRKALSIVVAPDKLRDLLGPTRYEDHVPERASRVGVATGLAWTSAGGEVLTVEAGVFPGGGNLLLTGQLGETMRDIHVHIPEGAVPKDGPSAGITLALAMVSALTGIPTRGDVALTGEITLRGTVLPVGGVGEKLVAARRAGVAAVVLPRGNAKHLAEVPRELLEGLCTHTVESIDEVLSLGLEAPTETRFEARDGSDAASQAA
jgi:ATP-dependent Lon protease